MNNVLKVDKAYRNRLFAAYLIAIAACSLALLFGLPPALRHLKRLDILSELDEIEGALGILFVIPALAAAVLIRVGLKAMRHRAYPYPGMKVIRDTVIAQGSRAIARGRALVILGIASIGLSVMSICVTHHYFNRLRTPPKLEWPAPLPLPPPRGSKI